MLAREEYQTLVDSKRKRQPFYPFIIEMDDGDRFLIDRPEKFHCWMGSGTLTEPDGSFHFVDWDQVKAVVDAPGNGLAGS